MPKRLSFGIGIVALALSLAPASPVRAVSGSAVTADGQATNAVAACAVQAVPHCGDTAAQYHLGLLFENGIGVPKDPVAALGWFLCAARSNGQMGSDAAKWAEHLSSSLDGPTVLAARTNMLGCQMRATTVPPPETSEALERLGTENTPHWKKLHHKLNHFLESILRFETVGSGSGHPANRTAASGAPRIRTQQFATVPDRRHVWSKVFFLPADGTIVGSQHIAWNLGADGMLRDLREIARDSNDLTLGLFAIFWWALIGKTLVSIGRVIFGSSQKSGSRRLGQRSLIAPWR